MDKCMYDSPQLNMNEQLQRRTIAYIERRKEWEAKWPPMIQTTDKNFSRDGKRKRPNNSLHQKQKFQIDW